MGLRQRAFIGEEGAAEDTAFQTAARAYLAGERDALAPLKACGVTSLFLEDVAACVDACTEPLSPSGNAVTSGELRKLAAALKECGL